MRWLLYILGGLAVLLLGLWAVFRFVVKPGQRSPQEAAARGLAVDAPLTVGIPQMGGGAAPQNKTADALAVGGAILATLGGGARTLGIRL